MAEDITARLAELLETLATGSADLPATPEPELDATAMAVLTDLAERLHDNYPYAHPLYAGQMLKPPHPVAWAAYAMAMTINPNNHALDGGRATSALEREVVADLAGMFGLGAHLGHLTGGGTMANLEALWVGSKVSNGVVLASQQAHYTHARISDVLSIGFETVASDADGRMDIACLERRLAAGGVGMVVATAGTTGLGRVDPVADIAELCAAHGVRLHVDAAYGGYFGLAAGLDAETRRHMDAIARADSIVIDPHKHGLQPYGCGCVLFRDPEVGRLYKHDSPYTYFSSDDLHLGEISLECSRPGAAAAALWATHQYLPPVVGGRFSGDLDRCLSAARGLADGLRAADGWRVITEPELDIVSYAPDGASSSVVSELSRRRFDEMADADLHLALLKLPRDLVSWPDLDWDTDTLTCLRSCLMKPEHEAWLPQILTRLAP
jgi:glutamate/tyrosine decarboxylase-like PLP-dependent enzyme